MEKILIVDDLETNRAALKECFKNTYDIAEAENGGKAMEILKEQNDICLVLLDLFMPGMNGFEVIKEMKSTESLKEIPIVVNTAYGEDENEIRALTLGADDFIFKPYNPELIKHRVMNVMYIHGLLNHEKEEVRIRRRMEEKIRKSEQELKHVINCIPGGVAVYRVSDIYETIYYSEGIPELSGYTKEEYDDLIKGDAADFIYERDRTAVRAELKEAVEHNKQVDINFRKFHKNGKLVWVNLQAKVVGEQDGRPLIHCVYHNISRQTELYQEILDESPLAIYVIDNHTFEILYMNKSAYEAVGRDFENCNGKVCYRFIHGNGEPCSFCKREKFNQRGLTETELYLARNKRHFTIAGKNINWRGREAFIEYVTNITEQKTFEEQIKMANKRFEIAVSHSNVFVWEYDLIHNKYIKMERDGFGKATVTKFLPPDIFGLGRLSEESETAYKRMLQRLSEGEREAEAVLHSTNKEGNERYHKVTYTTVYDSNGKPASAIGCSVDITEQKNMEKRYNEELTYRKIMQRSAVASFRLNLTKNWCGDGESIYPGMQLIDTNRTVDGFFERVNDNIPVEEDREAYKAVFNREKLMKCFYEGTYRIALEHRYLVGKDKTIWLSATANIMTNPENGNVEAFVYAYDISDKKEAEGKLRETSMLVNTVVSQNYDYIADIDIGKDTYVIYTVNSEGQFISHIGMDYEESARVMIEESVPDEYKEMVYQNLKLNYMEKRLEEEGAFTFEFKQMGEDGTLRHKEIKVFYNDKKTKHICVASTDVTDLLLEEQHKNELLASALKAAQQANTAKTDFLSRMSHEIRTPMNAIIGMSAIAMESLEDKEQTAECISKITLSSRYLLSLINDILDMSRIESGKNLLKKEKIAFQRFLEGIGTICESQAGAKNITYSNTMSGRMDESYIGDFMKLQQVIINIVSNAIKFTPENGKVELIVSELKKDKNKATLRFIIRDTGCGISEEFIPKMFEPFSQENSGMTSSYGGTGLGLAICRNLVNMMEGNIRVKSTLGKGSEFCVDVKLDISEEAKKAFIKNEDIGEKVEKKTDKKEMEYNFNGKRILLAEDHPMNVEVAKRLLLKKGCLVEHAENGVRAVEMFALAPENYYDLILMDIRMPVMDGLQAAEEIRRAGKKYAKTVPIIAMTANAFDEDMEKSMQAGMNAHLGKPIEPEMLYETMKEYLYRRAKRDWKQKEQEDGVS